MGADVAAYNALNTENEKAKFRRKIVRDNPHIVDTFFYERVNEALNSFFGKKGLEIKWSWFRIEYQ